MDYIELGKRIRQQRRSLELTQDALAHEVGVTAAYIGHIERGTKHCTVDTLVDICNALRVTPNLLLQDSLTDEVLGMDMSPFACSLMSGFANVLREHEL